MKIPNKADHWEHLSIQKCRVLWPISMVKNAWLFARIGEWAGAIPKPRTLRAPILITHSESTYTTRMACCIRCLRDGMSGCRRKHISISLIGTLGGPLPTMFRDSV